MKTEAVWLITGASRGLGHHMAQAALAAGDKVVATGRGADGLAQALGHPSRVLALALDVTDEFQAISVATAAIARFGRIDVLVNNAGFGLIGAIEEANDAEVRHQFDTNVFGLLNVTRAVLPHMRAQRSGRIINISSLGGYAGAAGFGIYCASKFAVEGLTEALAQEVQPLGIHVSVVEPGYFRTDFNDKSSKRLTALQIDDYTGTDGNARAGSEHVNHQQPGDPAKLAALMVELANDAAPPLRLPVGRDAIDRVLNKNAKVAAEVEAWRSRSVATAF